MDSNMEGNDDNIQWYFSSGCEYLETEQMMTSVAKPVSRLLNYYNNSHHPERGAITSQ